jgi:hypothetical protein
MWRAGALLLGVLCGLTGLGESTAGAAESAESAGSAGRHEYIRIRNWMVHPRTLRVAAGREIGWINQTARGVRVQLDREVAGEMVCHDGSAFRLTGDFLESPEIRATQFASMCSLTPGVYAYRVFFPGEGGAGGAPPVGRTLRGRLIVE